ncbi:MAG: 2-phospho-L-lactate transferase, partial [Minicystis sp.]
PATTVAIAAHYGELLTGIVVEEGDESGLGDLPVLATRTVMKTRADSLRLCQEVLAFAEPLLR